MSTFQRKLDLDAMSDANLASAPWLTEMLRHWYPAGHATNMVQWSKLPGSKKESGLRPMGLRLAVRNGSLNFYCGGQSVAKVTLGRSLKAETHAKYLTDDVVNGQIYQKLGTEHADITSIMTRTHGYHGVEKLFVEAICAKNGTIIDIEMGLPGLPVEHPKTKEVRLVAPRIDLVALEPVVGGWKVVFWEAKLPGDRRMSTRSEEPEVVAQLETYSAWFADEAAKEAVLVAYRETCALLFELHQHALNLGLNVLLQLDPAIEAIAKTPTLLIGIDPKVRLLIDLRKDDPHFPDGHLSKLEQHGIPVHCVRSEDDLPLPAMAAVA